MNQKGEQSRPRWVSQSKRPWGKVPRILILGIVFIVVIEFAPVNVFLELGNDLPVSVFLEPGASKILIVPRWSSGGLEG